MNPIVPVLAVGALMGSPTKKKNKRKNGTAGGKKKKAGSAFGRSRPVRQEEPEGDTDGGLRVGRPRAEAKPAERDAADAERRPRRKVEVRRPPAPAPTGASKVELRKPDQAPRAGEVEAKGELEVQLEEVRGRLKVSEDEREDLERQLELMRQENRSLATESEKLRNENKGLRKAVEKKRAEAKPRESGSAEG